MSAPPTCDCAVLQALLLAPEAQRPGPVRMLQVLPREAPPACTADSKSQKLLLARAMESQSSGQIGTAMLGAGLTATTSDLDSEDAEGLSQKWQAINSSNSSSCTPQLMTFGADSYSVDHCHALVVSDLDTSQSAATHPLLNLPSPAVTRPKRRMTIDGTPVGVPSNEEAAPRRATTDCQPSSGSTAKKTPPSLLTALVEDSSEVGNSTLTAKVGAGCRIIDCGQVQHHYQCASVVAAFKPASNHQHLHRECTPGRHVAQRPS
jgi:hypothetical protein